MKVCRYILVFAALAWTSVALGQVTRRQTGNALDANYSLTSGRFNTPGQSGRRIDGNLFVTGQVTGGFQFRGNVGYVAPNQLRLDVPSAGLDDFVRGSVGVRQLMLGPRFYGPGIYLSPSQTAMGVAGIRRGLNRPGTSTPQATYISPAKARQLYDTAVTAYQPIDTEMGKRLRINPLISPLAAGSEETALSRRVKIAREKIGAFRPQVSPLFGLIRRQEPQEKDTEPADDTQRFGEERDGARPDKKAPSGAKQQPTGRQQELPLPNQDVFVDMLVGLNDISQDAEATTDVSPGLIGASRDSPDKTKTPGSVEVVSGKVVLHRLAGRSGDMFNHNMNRGEKALAAGNYYDAASYYGMAHILNRGNPLASVGASLAFFAADEPLSGAFHLRRAFEQFPPVMTTRVDVTKLLGGRAVKNGITRLESRLGAKATEADAPLYFLAAFIRSATGQQDKAAEYAKRLKTIAGQDKVYRAYADHLLKQRSPPAAAPKATAPRNK